MDSLRGVNKYDTKEYVWFGENQVQIIEWKLNTDTNVIRYHVENKLNGFKAWIAENQLSKDNPNVRQ